MTNLEKLVEAINVEDFEKVKELAPHCDLNSMVELSKGTKRNEYGNDKMPLIAYSLFFKHKGIVKLLIKSGASTKVNVRYEGLTMTFKEFKRYLRFVKMQQNAGIVSAIYDKKKKGLNKSIKYLIITKRFDDFKKHIKERNKKK